MSLSDRQIGDLVTGTLDRLGRLRFVQLAQRLQDYEVMQRMMKKDKVTFEDGTGIQRTLMVDHSGAARMAKLYDPDVVSVGDVLTTINIPWRHTKVSYAFERRELLMNKGMSKVTDLLTVRRADAMIALAELMEEQVWQGAPVTTTNDIDVYSIPYWIVYNATTGFTGGNGTNASIATVDCDVVTRWKNYSANYTNVTKTDLIKKMRTAYRKIKFKSPVTVNDFRKGAGDNYRLYTNESVLNDLELLGEAQNENLGRDIASMDGTITFRRNPIVWVPTLDDATDGRTNPIYMVNMSCFNPVCLKGDVMRESDPEKSADDHNVFVVHVDLTWNMLCTDRRRQAILATA